MTSCDRHLPGADGEPIDTRGFGQARCEHVRDASEHRTYNRVLPRPDRPLAVTDTEKAKQYRNERDGLTNQLEAAGHAVALTRALRSYLIEESISVAVLAEFIGDALRVDPARVTVGMLPRNGLQIRVLP